jgi:hypothetical protein
MWNERTKGLKIGLKNRLETWGKDEGMEEVAPASEEIQDK